MSSKEIKERRFFIVAGEASGDHHAAALMKDMLARDPGCRFAGIGGPQMKAQGLDDLYHIDEMAVMGFSEVLYRLPFFWRVMRAVIEYILSWEPERVILIDYPGFNLRLARRLCGTPIPVSYYISPQLWAWKAGRIRTIRRCVDQMLVIFPFEEAWYRARGVEAQFVGHPFLEEPEPQISREEYLQSIGFDVQEPVLTLFPGSRKQELERHLPALHAAARMLKEAVPNMQVLMGLAKGLSLAWIPKFMHQDITVTTIHPRLALRYADAAIVASGTSTLEAAIWGVPMVVVYKMSALSAWLGRRLVNVPHVGMVNILAEEEVVPEFLQERLQPGPITRAILRFFQDEAYGQTVREQLRRVRESLRPPAQINGDGASMTVAKAILKGT